MKLLLFSTLAFIVPIAFLRVFASAQVDSGDVSSRGNSNAAVESASNATPTEKQCVNVLKHAKAVAALRETSDYKFCEQTYPFALNNISPISIGHPVDVAPHLTSHLTPPWGTEP